MLEQQVQGNKITVLVVDDEEAVRVVTRRILEAHGIEVLDAKSGEETLSLLTDYQGRCLVVLIEMFMTDTDGEDVFRKIRRRYPDIPVLITSSYSEEEAAGRFVDVMPTGFVKKPYRPEELAEKIRQAI